MINLVVQERVQFASCHATTTYDSSWLKSRITLDRQRRGREKSARGVKKKRAGEKCHTLYVAGTLD